MFSAGLHRRTLLKYAFVGIARILASTKDESEMSKGTSKKSIGQQKLNTGKLRDAYDKIR